MSLGHGSSIVREGLVFYVDSSNIKSYPGAGTTWKDLSGNAFDVQLPAGVTYDSPYMAFGGSSMIDLGNNPTLLSNDLTYEAWVKPASIPSWMGVISCVPSWGSGFGLQVGSTNGLAAMVSGSYLKAGIQPEIETWYHLAATYSSLDGAAKIYVNGEEKNSISRTVSYSTGAVTKIATFYTTGTLYFDGYIPIAGIYNKALRSTEVKQNFEATKSRFGL